MHIFFRICNVKFLFAKFLFTVCVILHNICEIHHERYIYDWNEQNDEEVDNNQVDDDDTNKDALTSAKSIYSFYKKKS
jgi:hypothetical protein